MPQTTPVSEAIRLFRSGEKQAALARLHEILRANPQNMYALLWLAGLTPDLDEGIAALNKVLELEPQHQAAQRGLADLRARRAALQTQTTAAAVLPRQPSQLNVVVQGQPTLMLDAPAAASEPEPEPGCEITIFTCGAAQKDKRLAAARRVSRTARWGVGLALLAWAALLGAGVILGLRGLPAPWLSAIGLAASIPLAGLAHFSRSVNTQIHLTQGLQAEEKLIDMLRSALHGRWLLYRGLTLPGGGPIDLVLVGPKGIFALEVKAYPGAFRNLGDRWQRKAGLFWVGLARNPTRQVRHHAVQLRQYLRSKSAAQFIAPRIVWAGPGRLWLQKPAVPFWQMNNPRGWLEDMLRQGELPPQAIQQVAAALEALCPDAKESIS
jgi:hypothetical protein